MLGAHGGDRHPAFPAPSVLRAAKRRAKLGQFMSRECGCMTHIPRHTRIVVPARAGTHNHLSKLLCTLATAVPPITFAAAYGFSESSGANAPLSIQSVHRLISRECERVAYTPMLTRSLQLVPVGRVSPSHRRRMTSSAAACYSTAAPTGGPPGGRCRKVIDA